MLAKILLLVFVITSSKTFSQQSPVPSWLVGTWKIYSGNDSMDTKFKMPGTYVFKQDLSFELHGIKVYPDKDYILNGCWWLSSDSLMLQSYEIPNHPYTGSQRIVFQNPSSFYVREDYGVWVLFTIFRKVE